MPEFLDKADPVLSARGACQTISRDLRKEGIGAEMKHTEIFTPEEEDLLWSSGAIGMHSPISLVRTLFFYLSKTLCLCGGQEQRDLKPSQF